MEKKLETEVAVIGAGPGGYVCAIRLGQLGKDVVLIERMENLGGECLNFGCIPSKTLIHVADQYYSLQQAEKFGIKVSHVEFDAKKMQEWKQHVVKTLTSGVKLLCKGYGAKILHGMASFEDPHTLKVQTHEGETVYVHAKNIVIATGTTFIELPGFSYEHPRVLNAKKALNLDYIPEKMLIIGGGIIGLELGTVFAKLGSKVTVVELLDQLLPGINPRLVRYLQRNLKKLGFTIYTKSKATHVEHHDDENLSIVTVETPKGEIKIEANVILVSVGKKISHNGLNIEKSAVKTDKKGFIIVNEKLQTNVPHIYAIGDVTGPPFLAHRAMKQGAIAAEIIAGKEVTFHPKAIPMAIFTDPEIAFTGLDEQAAKEKGHEILIGQVPFTISGKAYSMDKAEGFVRIIADKESKKVLGVEMIGPHVTELIHEVNLAIEKGATLEDLINSIHVHPTLFEVIAESAEDALGKPIHYLKK